MRFQFSKEVQAPSSFPSNLRLEDCFFGFELRNCDSANVSYHYEPFYPSLQITEDLMLRLWSNRYFQHDGWLVFRFGLRTMPIAQTTDVDSKGTAEESSNWASRAFSFVCLFNPATGETKELGTASQLNALRTELLRAEMHKPGL